MHFHSWRLLLCALLLLVSFTTSVAAWPPVPPVIRPFDDPSIDVRYKAWRRDYDQSVSEASNKLKVAMTTIENARQNGSGATEAEKQAAREFVVARKLSHESLRGLALLKGSTEVTASKGDINRLKEEFNRELSNFYRSEWRMLERFEAMID